MKILSLLLIFLPWLTFSQTSNEHIDKNKVQKANKAYFFLKGQELSLQYLSAKDSDYKNMESEIDHYFFESQKNLKTYLESYFGNQDLMNILL